jgi:hypothetical protein
MLNPTKEVKLEPKVAVEDQRIVLDQKSMTQRFLQISFATVSSTCIPPLNLSHNTSHFHQRTELQ